MNSGIYQIRNKVNGKIYIGSAVHFRNRWNKHKRDLQNNIHKNQYLQNAWNKRGEQNFVFEILQYTEKSDVVVVEQYYLDWLEPWRPEIGYNICHYAGSCLGVKRTEETKRKMSETKKGNKYWLGKKHSEETKNKISQSQLGTKNHMFGKKISEETKNKISTSLSGENHPLFGKHHSEEAKKKMSDFQKIDRFNKSTLTWELVREIRRKRKEEKTLYKVLARDYNITLSSIQAIIENRRWKEENAS